MRETTVMSVKGVISKLGSIESGFKIKRKDQTGSSSLKLRWWFTIHVDESVLAKLETGWGVVSDHTSWKLQFCYKPGITQPALLLLVVPRSHKFSSTLE